MLIQANMLGCGLRPRWGIHLDHHGRPRRGIRAGIKQEARFLLVQPQYSNCMHGCKRCFTVELRDPAFLKSVLNV